MSHVNWWMDEMWMKCNFLSWWLHWCTWWGDIAMLWHRFPRPDITVMVDWALKTNNQSIPRSVCRLGPQLWGNKLCLLHSFPNAKMACSCRISEVKSAAAGILSCKWVQCNISPGSCWTTELQRREGSNSALSIFILVKKEKSKTEMTASVRGNKSKHTRGNKWTLFNMD